jgi:hypothetical protein
MSLLHELAAQLGEYHELFSAERYLKPAGLRLLSPPGMMLYYFRKSRSWAVEVPVATEAEAERLAVRIRGQLVGKRSLTASDPFLHDRPLFVIYQHGIVRNEAEAPAPRGPSAADQKHKLLYRAKDVFGERGAQLTGGAGDYRLRISPAKREWKGIFSPSTVQAATLDELAERLEEVIAKAEALRGGHTPNARQQSLTPNARVFIDKGWLIQSQEIVDELGNRLVDKRGEPYFAILEFQVFDETGAPAERSYRGEGLVDPPRIVLGDAHRDTQLLEGTVARQASSESWQRYLGYKSALLPKRPLTEKKERELLAVASAAFLDGYRDGMRDRRERGVQREPQSNFEPNDAYSPFQERLPGGRAAGMRPEDFDPVQLEIGTQHELEHTDDWALAQEIAMDHLAEDDQYYAGEKVRPNAVPGSMARNGAREIADALPVPGGATRFQCLAVVKLARLNGVAPLAAFTRQEIARLRGFVDFAKSYPNRVRPSDRRDVEYPGWVRFFQGPDGASVELTAAGWGAINAANEYLAQSEHTPNGGYYVWVLDRHGEPMSSEGPHGPHDLQGAKTYARIAATNGEHDRVVSRGVTPSAASFEIVRRYRAGTGERVI